jgi:S-adenosylmethionine:tRNA ribosyltransferase-isomerase
MAKIIKNTLTDTALVTSDFFYELPEELIAQVPADKRDCSRLMVLDKENGGISHKIFSDVIDYLQEGDVLVLNRSRVIPARLYGKRADTGADIEILLLKKMDGDVWETLVKPGKKCKVGTRIVFGDGLLKAEIIGITEEGNRHLRFAAKSGTVSDAIHEIGQMPLPPYITSRASEKERYQTVYSKEEGSAAAPTAGLHFTPELLKRIEDKGVKVVTVLLHVGLGTFRPVKEREIQKHVMHAEWFSIAPETAETINNRKGRLICVGTTSCRVIESVADENGKVNACEGETAIFIYPGYTFKAIEGLITNFHLPESTLIMLVSAFAGRENVLNAYETAVKEKYRFFSFGDAMLIV